MCLGGRARGKKGDSGWRLAVSGWGERGSEERRTRGHEGWRAGGHKDSRTGGLEGWRTGDRSVRGLEGQRDRGPEDRRARGPEDTGAGSRGYVPATCHPGMGALGQHAVQSLPCEGFAFDGRDAAPLPNPSLANRPTGQPVNFVPPSPRVTLPTCPLRRLGLRFRLPNERKDTEGHRDEPGVAGPLGRAEEFR